MILHRRLPVLTGIQTGFCRVYLGPFSLVLLYLYLACISADAAGGVVRIGNKSLQLAVDPTNGRITEFIDMASKQNFATADPGIGGLWELEFAGVPTTKLSPNDAHTFAVEKLPGKDLGLRMEWNRFTLPDAPDLRIEVTVRLEPKQALSRWGIAVIQPGHRALIRIRFPRIVNLPRLRKERLVMPFWVGLLAANPRHLFSSDSMGAVRREYDYPGHCSMQCLTYYDHGGPGLYVACDDTAGYRKLFAAFSERGTGLNLEIVHLPELQGSNSRSFVLPYSAVLGTFRGDWYDAAAIYRSWAIPQTWARESRWKRGVVPPWIADTGIWVWNRGRSADVLDPAIALQQETGLPVSVFWHWWHGCAYDTGFPEYLPPREGQASFAAALTRAQQHDVHSLVYMNQRLWGMTTASWTKENAALYAVKTIDGKIRPEVYNRFTKLPCATMCMGTEFWRTKYAGLATEAFNRLGVDGIYMDQACSSLACFDPQHGHPLGGGTYWMNGFKSLAADIRRRCTMRGGVTLAGEGCAENWLPYLDLMLALDVSRERYAAPDGWETIPFFHAVYHGYGVFYGNYSSLTMPPYDDLWPAEFAPQEPLKLLDRKFSRQFFLEQARSFLWGQQLTIANFKPSHFRDRADEMAYVVRLAKLRKLSLKYLQDGTMLPPPTVKTPNEEIPISRLSIYAGQQETLKEFQKTVPLVLASAWRASDGKVAIAIAAIANRSITPTLLIDAVKCGLPKRGYVYLLNATGAKRIGKFSGKTVTLKPNLEPLDARVLELSAY